MLLEVVVVVWLDGELSYGELNVWVNWLVCYFCGLGVGFDVWVGLCVECLVELLVGILVILKVGGVYVLLDLVYLVEWLGYMLVDVVLVVVLVYVLVCEVLMVVLV